jgi:hypothetical protein
MRPRHSTLILNLTSRSFKVPPKGVGVKTIFEARDAGLIQIDLSFAQVMCKLTEKGSQVRKSLARQK